jgi:hypothetical protein
MAGFFFNVRMTACSRPPPPMTMIFMGIPPYLHPAGICAVTGHSAPSAQHFPCVTKFFWFLFC